MASFDIFNDNAFGLSQLTQTIVDLPRVPTMLGDMGLFNEYGISTTTMMIERTGSKLRLVPVAPRGGPGQTLTSNDRKLIPISAVHLPQTDTIEADIVQGVRAFGTESEVEAMSRVVANRLAQMKSNLDLTLEWQRIGAVKGSIKDADGSEILNVYDRFGMTQQTEFFNIATANSAGDPKASTIAVKRKIRTKLGGRGFRRVRYLCSEGFFDKLIAHDKMAAAYERWQAGAFFREDQTEADFVFAGAVYTIYDGEIGGNPVIEDGFAYAMPEGVPNMFQIAYAPANYMETVNTVGSPYYAKQERMKFDKGIEMESQSNPICFNALPEAVIKVSAAAS